MKASELQMEETDKALANTLDAIRAGGPGAGNATALAQMAAVSKAEVAANIEQQEASNMQLRVAGEQTRQTAIQKLETTALAEEVSAWGRQEDRDLAKMDRIAGLADRAHQQSVAYDQAADQNAADMWGSITDLGMSGLSMAEGMNKSGTSNPGTQGRFGAEYDKIKAGTSNIAASDQFGNYQEFHDWWKKNK